VVFITLENLAEILIDASVDKGKSFKRVYGITAALCPMGELTLLKCRPGRETKLTVLFSLTTYLTRIVVRL